MFNDEPVPSLNVAPVSDDVGMSVAGRLAEVLIAFLPEADDNEVTVRMARGYERKTSESYDRVPGKRNSYGSASDDYVVSLSFRVPAYAAEHFSKLADIDQAITAVYLDREQAHIREQMAALEAQEAKLAEDRAALAARLTRGTLDAPADEPRGRRSHLADGEGTIELAVGPASHVLAPGDSIEIVVARETPPLRPGQGVKHPFA